MWSYLAWGGNKLTSNINSYIALVAVILSTPL